MSKLIGYCAFFLMLVDPLVVFSQGCNDAIIATTSHLQDNADGTVSDAKTGLIWKKCSEGQRWNADMNACDGSVNHYTWQAALQQSEQVNQGNAGENLAKVDWRLPNIKELASIVELKCWQPSINISVFPATRSAWVWSSSSLAIVTARGSSISAAATAAGAIRAIAVLFV